MTKLQKDGSRNYRLWSRVSGFNLVAIPVYPRTSQFMAPKPCSQQMSPSDRHELKITTRAGLMSHENWKLTALKNGDLTPAYEWPSISISTQVLQQKCQRAFLRGRRFGPKVENKPRWHAQALITIGRSLHRQRGYTTYFLQAGTLGRYRRTKLLAHRQAQMFLSLAAA